MTQIRLVEDAEEELRSASRFYAEENTELGAAFVQEIRISLKRIAEMPLAGKVERGDVRVRSIARFPYRIYYRVGGSEILIVAIGHRRQRPGFWHGRIAT